MSLEEPRQLCRQPRRSKVLVVAALTTVALACSTPAEISAPEATARCVELEMPELQGGSHLIGGQEPPVPYSSTPPTSGWHSSGEVEITVQPSGEPLSEPEQVSVLESGGVVVTYNGLEEPDRAALEQRAADRFEGRAAVTSYDKLDTGEVVFTAWGALQRCDGVDLEALDAFVAAYADDRPADPDE